MPVNEWKDVRVVVTGGLGFIGSALAARLVDLGADVVVIDDLNADGGGSARNGIGYDEKVRTLLCDIADPLALGELEDAEVLFNLAARTSHRDSMENPLVDVHANCVGPLAMLDVCRRVNTGIRIVFASTRQLYGRPKYLPVDEQHPLNPVDVNGINKMAAEHYHLLYARVYGIRVRIVRLTNTYGPRMRIRDARQNFFGLWVRLLLEGKPLPVWGGEQLRDLSYVDDAVDALLAASTSNGEQQIFNVAGAQVVSLRTLAGMLIEQNGEGRYEVQSFPEASKSIDVGDYHGSSNELARLGWAATVPLEEGMRRTLEFFRGNLEHYL